MCLLCASKVHTEVFLNYLPPLFIYLFFSDSLSYKTVSHWFVWTSSPGSACPSMGRQLCTTTPDSPWGYSCAPPHLTLHGDTAVHYHTFYLGSGASNQVCTTTQQTLYWWSCPPHAEKYSKYSFYFDLEWNIKQFSCYSCPNTSN